MKKLVIALVLMVVAAAIVLWWYHRPTVERACENMFDLCASEDHDRAVEIERCADALEEADLGDDRAKGLECLIEANTCSAAIKCIDIKP